MIAELLERPAAGARVFVDCTPSGNEMKEKWYEQYEKDTDLFIAQGSEFGFGKPYARGINEDALKVIEEAVDKAGYAWGEQIFVALDPATSEGILDLLRKIQQRDRITLVVSLHQVEFARRYAERVIGSPATEGRVKFGALSPILTFK